MATPDRAFCQYCCTACGHYWAMIHDVGIFVNDFSIDCPECDEPNEPTHVDDQGKETDLDFV